jgi:hypothetical protein
MAPKRIIGVRMHSGTEWHVPGEAPNRDTLCGVNANDGARGHTGTVPAMRTQKVTCVECRDMALLAKSHISASAPTEYMA